MKFWPKLRALFRRNKLDAEMAEEMRMHLELQTERNAAAGMNVVEARYAAHRQFGGVEQIKEQARDQRSLVWLEQWIADARFSLRSLSRAPGFTLALVVSLVLGIGAGAAVFNLSIQSLFKDAPYTNSNELLAIGYTDKRTSFSLDISGVQFLSYQEQTSAFVGFAAIEGRLANVVIDGELVPANHVAISVDGFSTLGITPALGRLFDPGEYRAGLANVAIVTDAFWRGRLNADPSVLGREVFIDQQPCKIIGVLRPGQTIPFRFQGEVYRPLIFTMEHNRFGPGIHLVGRLRTGVSPERARAELAAVRYPTLTPAEAEILQSEKAPAVVGINEVNERAIWWVLLVAGILLFAISCMNATNLMLFRLLRRTRELSIRLAVGCTRLRIARLVLMESVALATAAGVVVILFAWSWFQPLYAALWGNPDTKFDVFADWITVGSVLTMCVVATAALALIPIWRISHLSKNNSLKPSGVGTGEPPGIVRVRNILVVLQAGLAVVLLVGTGLMIKSVQRLHAVDLGFDPYGKVKVWLAFPPGFEPEAKVRVDYFERLTEHVARIPGVKSVAYGEDALLVGAFWGWASIPMKDGVPAQVALSFLSAEYGRTAGMRLKRGRWFSGRQNDWEVVINETLARTRFGDDDPIGQVLKFSDKAPACRVVGVVADVKENLRTHAGMRLYLPGWVAPWNLRALVLQMSSEPGREIVGVVRRAVYEFDPMLICNYVGPMSEVVHDGMGEENFARLVLRGLAMIALALAVLGLGSVMAFTVHARNREFAVRLALGAVSADIQRLVLMRGMAVVGAGLLLGVVVALSLTHFMRSLLFETAPHDLGVYATVGATLLGTAVAACWLPVRRVAKVDPMVALRCE